MLGLHVYRVFKLYTELPRLYKLYFTACFQASSLCSSGSELTSTAQLRKAERRKRNSLRQGACLGKAPWAWGYPADMGILCRYEVLTGQVSTDPSRYVHVLSQHSGLLLAQCSQLPDSPSLQPQDPCALEPGISPSCGPAQVSMMGL